MGGAQPLAGTMAGAAILCIEVDPHAIERRLETRYLDEATDSLDDALARVARPQPTAVRSRWAARECGGRRSRARGAGEDFDLVTDQTAAHDPLNGYVPRGYLAEEEALRASDPDEYLTGPESIATMSKRCSSTSDSVAMFSIMATTCGVRRVKVA